MPLRFNLFPNISPIDAVSVSGRLPVMNSFRTFLLLVSLIAFLAACSSPEERAQEYFESGQAWLAEDDAVKAKLEFQNALQLDQTIALAWYGLAMVAEKESNWEEMFTLLNTVKELNPAHLPTQIKLGQLLLSAGEIDAALEISNSTMELAPDDVDVLSLRAAIFFKLEDTFAAVEFAHAALQSDPNHIDALIVLATERLSAGDAKKAIEFLDQGLSQNEENIALQLIKIEALNQLEQFNAVEDIHLQLIDSHPDTDVFMHRLASFYLSHDRQTDAEQIFRNITLANPEDMDAKLNVVRFVNSIHGINAAISEVSSFISADPNNMEWAFVLAELYLANNQPEQAIQRLESIIATTMTTTDRLRAMGQLAIFRIRNDQQSAAMILVEEILTEEPRNEEALIIKATQLIDNRELDAAISNLRTILRDVPDSERALLLLGKAHQLSGSMELANDVYERAFRASEKSPDFGLPYADFLLDQQRVQRASSILEDGLLTNPDHLKSLTMLAQIQLSQGNWLAAQALADHIHALEDSQSTISQEILGAAYAGQQDFDQSIAAFTQAFQSAPSEVRPMVSLARTYLTAGKPDEAMSFLESVLSVSENNNNARLLIGQLHMMQNNDAKAFSTFREVIEREPTNITAYSDIASMNARLGKLEEAIQILDEGLAVTPGDLQLNLMKASLYETQNEYDAAINIYEALLEEQPNVDVVVNNLASLLTDHRTDETSLNRALELATRFRSSSIPYFQDTLGWAHFRLGNAQDAMEIIRDVTEEMPTVPVFRYHLGMAYMGIDENELARRNFEQALELAGASPSPFREQVEQAMTKL